MKPSFLVLLISQTLCSITSTMVIFSVMMSTYGENSSVKSLSWIYVATAIPALFIAVPAGMLIDRFSKKTNLLVADLIIAAAIGSLFFLLGSNLWVIFFVMLAIQVGISYQGLTNQALIAHYFNKNELHLINGLLQFKKAFQKLIAPALGGYLYSLMPIKNILQLHLVSLLLAILCLTLIKIPALEQPKAQSAKNFELLAGFKYIFQNKDLKHLAWFFFNINFLAGIYSVVYTPVLLEFADEKSLGLALSIGSLGMIIASLSAINLKFIKIDRYTMLVILVMLNGVSEMLSSYQSFYIYALGLFVGSWCSSYIAIINAVMWQSQVSAHVQGRTFGARDFMALGSLPLGMLCGGWLGDFAKLSFGLWFALFLVGLVQLSLGAFYWLAHKKKLLKLEFVQ